MVIASCTSDGGRAKIKADATMHVGIASINAGDYGGALKELLRAQQLDPKNHEINYYLALAYQGKGYCEQAIVECNEAIRKKRDYSEAYNLLGTLYLNQGNYDRALSCFKKALENVTYETPAVALYNLGRTYQRMKSYDEALARLQEAVVKDFRGEMLPLIEFTMGEVNYERGAFERAIVHFKRTIDIAPLFADAYYLLGESYLRQGDRQGAMEAWNKVITLVPDSQAARMAKERLSRIRE